MVPKVTLKKYEARRYTKNDRDAEKEREQSNEGMIRGRGTGCTDAHN